MFISLFYKSFVVLAISIFVALTMSEITIDIADNALPASLQKSQFSQYLKNLPSKLTFASAKEWFGVTRANIRPWGEFANTDNFKTPPSLQRMLKRAVNNVSHFQGNYLTISTILMAYSLLTSPLLLMAIILTVLIGKYLANRNEESKFFIGGKEVTLHQQYLALALVSIPAYIWAGVKDIVFWVLGVSCFLTSLHAAFYNIDAIIRPDEQLSIVANQYQQTYTSYEIKAVEMIEDPTIVF